MIGLAPRLPRCSLPLLARELVESANRRRTYTVRVLFVMIALTLFGSEYHTFSRLNMQFGMGRYLFTTLTGSLYAGILLLLPAMAAASITQEKEQGTLVLLMLTLMGPWQLILQKFLSLTFLMLALLLVTLPLLGMSYVLGGMDFSSIWNAVIGIVLTIFELAALGLAIGSWSRRTTAAIVTCYLVVGGMLVLIWLLQFLGYARHAPLTQWFHVISYCFPYMSDGQYLSSWLTCVPLGVTAGLLIVARLTLPRRLGVEGGAGLLGFLRLLDRGFERADARLLRRSHVRDLPDDQPVWWLEVNRKSLANMRYLVRIFLPIYGLLFLIGTADPQEIDTLFTVSMTLLLLPLVVVHASALSQERGAQTLDVLLSTPLSGTKILRQKSRALARLRWAATGSLLMLVAIRNWWPHLRGDATMHACIQGAGAILVPAICCWIAMLVAVRLKNHRKAAIVAICCCLGWLIGIPILLALVANFISYDIDNSALKVLCPVILLAESRENYTNLKEAVGLTGMLCTLAGYLTLWWALRWICITWGSRWLYRGDSKASM